MNKISFSDTHVYPGCFVTIPITPTSIAAATAEFTDGSSALAELERLGRDEVLIRIDSYITASHTRIPAKDWRLRYDNALSVWKVIARIRDL